MPAVPLRRDRDRTSRARRDAWNGRRGTHPHRDLIRAKMLARGVQTALHYPIPLHLQQAYAHLGYKQGDFPVAERIGRECFTLPMFPELTLEQQDAVIAALIQALSN